MIEPVAANNQSTKRKHIRDEASIKQIIEFGRQGVGPSQIAKRMGCSPGPIIRILQMNNVAYVGAKGAYREHIESLRKTAFIKPPVETKPDPMQPPKPPKQPTYDPFEALRAVGWPTVPPAAPKDPLSQIQDPELKKLVAQEVAKRIADKMLGGL